MFNKIAGAVLGTLLVLVTLRIVADALFGPEEPEHEEPGHEDVVEEPVINVAGLIAAADVNAGQNVAAQCMGCHTLNEGGANGVGPNLYGLIGRTIGGHAGFNYTPALAALGNEGRVWTIEFLDEFMAGPQAAVPGTAMPIAIANETDRHALVAYLATLGGTPGEPPTPPAEAPVTPPPAETPPATPPAETPATPPVEPAAAVPDAVAGEAAAALCRGCHTLNEGGANGVGPNLFGVVGRLVGGAPGFSYSAALAALNAEGATWTPERLDAFLANPGAAVPGTRMPLGVANATDRANIIAFLATLGAAPAEAPPATPPAEAPATPPPAETPPVAPPAAATPPPADVTLAPVAFTVTQANWGQIQYGIECAGCHAADLTGGRGPALKGEAFTAAWATRSVADLVEVTRTGAAHPGDAVTADDYAAIIAYVLRENGFQAGNVALPAAAADQAGIGVFQ